MSGHRRSGGRAHRADRVRRRRDDAGQSSIELLGAMPLLIIGFLAVLQLTLAHSTAQSAATAARAAARSLSLVSDPARADVTGTARAAVPGWVAQHLRVTSDVRNGTATVHVTCSIPLFLPGVGTAGEVHRSATFPRRSEEAPWD